MQRTIVWKGLDVDTDETCAVNYHDNDITVRSEISGWADGKPLTVEYFIRLGKSWDVLQFEVTAQVGTQVNRYAMHRDDSGKWRETGGEESPEFEGCDYIDISLTPLTNSLPINGLGLLEGTSKYTDVVYIDVLDNKLRRDRQQYTKLSRLKYKFVNDGGDFTAEIDVDEQGFVTDYPNLFENI